MMPEFTCGHKPWMGVHCAECDPEAFRMRPLSNVCPSCAAKDAELKRLRDAVEWARNEMLTENSVWHDEKSQGEYWEWFVGELDRRIDPYAAQRAYEDEHDRIKMGRK